MNYLSLLTEDEVRYICSAIPQKDTITYFRHNPKEFAKICPGFRASAITRLDIGKLLFMHRKRGFVSFFIEEHISDWLAQIQEHMSKCLKEGDTKDLAYIHTLPFSFFAGNVVLYFKLIGEEYSNEYITVLTLMATVIKEATEKQDHMQSTLKAKESEINKLQLELDSAKIDIQDVSGKLLVCSEEIKKLKFIMNDLEKLKPTVLDGENLTKELTSKLQKQKEATRILEAELSKMKGSRQQMEAQIIAGMEKRQTEISARQRASLKPICPKDMTEFIDYLGYNLESIGIPTGSKYFSLLKAHLSYILFQGVPILINRGMGMPLMRCIANSISGTPNVKTLTFNSNISEQAIDDFLSSNCRVICLDNFIGNFNETELLPLFDRHRDKIIFLTVAYDRTLYFIPDEFLKYCYYLNLNRIEGLSANAELNEDPSIIEEMESAPRKVNCDSRYSPLLRKMLVEIGFRQSLVEYKCSFISSELDLCRTLAFDILPYCIDVLQIPPFNTSERFVQYAGDSGRCPYKSLFKEWFA